MSKPRGQPWGLLWALIVANLYIKSFEHKAITSAVNPPRLWKRWLRWHFCHTSAITKRSEFLQHINSVDPSINITTEETRPGSSMPFLDTLHNTTERWNLNIQCIQEAHPTLIYIFSGTAITIWLANTVWLTPSHLGPKQCDQQTPSC